MQKRDAAAFLAGVSQTEGSQASSPTNLHVISGEVGTRSEDGKTTVAIDGLVFSEADDQYVEMDTLGGLEEGDVATIILTGEDGHAMTPLAIGAPGSVDIIRDTAEAADSKSTIAQAFAQAAKAVAEAVGQHFWTDSDGVHITEVTEDEWKDDEEGSTTYHSGANVLVNSIGQLFRNGLTNLLAIMPSGIAIYDGNGNDESNIVATFTKNLITLGQNTREAAIEMCGGAYEVRSSVHEITGSRVTHLTARESFEDSSDEWSETVSDIETSAGTATSRLGIRCEHHDGGYQDGGKTHSHDTYATIDAIADAGSSTIYLDADTIDLRCSTAGATATVVYDDPYTEAGITPNSLQLGNPTRYQDSGSYSITTAGIDSLKNGPHITIPAGSYIFVGAWIFNSASDSGDRNMQVGFRSGASGALWGERVRIRQSSGNFAVLNVSALRVFTSETTVYLAGSASIKSGAGDAWITAVRLN